MTTESLSWIATAWAWARANDIPNWLAIALTSVLWPVALILWQRRKVNGVHGLEVHFATGNIQIGGKPFSAIDIQFTNHTGAVAYVSGVRVKGCTPDFAVPVEASRDVAENSYHLKFMDDKGQFVMREVTLQTSTGAKTCMPAPTTLPTEFFTYSPSWLARRFGRRKYFVLEYTAMVATTRYSVATLY
jgi:hypothetical protein